MHFDNLGVERTKLVSLATDGIPQMFGRKAGMARLVKNSLINKSKLTNLLHSLRNSSKSTLQ